MDRDSSWDNFDDIFDTNDFSEDSYFDEILSQENNDYFSFDNKDVVDSTINLEENDDAFQTSTYNDLRENHPPISSGDRESKWKPFEPKPRERVTELIDGMTKEKLLKIIGIIVIILIIFIIIINLATNKDLYNNINNILENIVSVVLTWFVFSVITWGIVIYSIGRRYTPRGKGACFIVMAVWVAISYVFPSLGTLLIITMILLLIFGRTFNL